MNFHKLILIGTIFIFLDINIGFDVVPDFVGFIIVAYAFSKINVPYATLGLSCSLLLMLSSFIEMFQVQTQSIYFYGYVNFWMQFVFIAIGLVTILYYACIFYVSNKMLKIENSIFPKVFIGAQILIQLFTTLGLYLPYDVLMSFTLLIFILYFFIYIYYFVFLWKRKNMEKGISEAMLAQ